MKNELIKLAELAGVRLGNIGDTLFVASGRKIGDELWQPHKDISQALEVLQGGGYGYQIHYTKTDKSHRVRIKRKHVYWGHSKILPEAICKAVLKAITEHGK
ncbi:MAG TPA: hypothetical protein EYN67_14040 [Flavobacteriales bacterium]|nr:hypothetical protein [Flavobacteriales bacterium]